MRFKVYLTFLLVASHGLLIVAPQQAEGHGAFPMPLDLEISRTGTIVVATNFGVFTSNPGGDVWTWNCEDPRLADTTRFRFSDGGGRIYASGARSAAFSDDLGCSWQTTQGFRQHSTVVSSDVDGFNGEHHLLLRTRDGRGISNSIVKLAPGQSKFSTKPFDFLHELDLFSVHATDGDVYVTGINTQTNRPVILRSTEQGNSWESTAPAHAPGTLIEVPYVSGSGGQLLLVVSVLGREETRISEDGGRTSTHIPSVPGRILKAIKMDTGAMLLLVRHQKVDLVCAADELAGPYGCRVAPHRLRSLAHHDKTIWGLKEGTAEGLALVRSLDEGRSWVEQKWTAFNAKPAATTCSVRSNDCETQCRALVRFGLLSSQVCEGLSGVVPKVPSVQRDCVLGMATCCTFALLLFGWTRWPRKTSW